jgi:metallo-beta-lactamase class B
MFAGLLVLSLSLSPNLAVDELQANIYRVNQIAKPYQANSLLVVNGDDFILVDSKNDEADAKVLWTWILKQNKHAKLTVISSHFHADSTGSNAYYRKIGAKVITSDKTNDLLEKDKRPAQKGNDTFPIATSPALMIGKELVNIVYPGASHAPDDVVVYFPDREVLFGSCLTKPGKDLGYLGDADLKSWRQAMDKVKALPVKIVVPGHGEDFTPKSLDNTIKLLDAALRPGTVPSPAP